MEFQAAVTSSESSEDSECASLTAAVVCTSESASQSDASPPPPKRSKTKTVDSQPEKRFTHPPMPHDSCPKTSGVMDFMDWAVAAILSDADRAALIAKFKSPVSVGSMCSGMATEDLAMHAIQSALRKCSGHSFLSTSTFKTESAPKKASFLRRHVRKDVLIFNSNAQLAEVEPTTIDGITVPRPTCQVLTCGIVCVDVSFLSSSQKSIDEPGGKSSQSWTTMHKALSTFSFGDRPSLIILECTAGLAHKRRVDRGSPAADHISRKLGELGYVGEWRHVSADMFYLPQSRPRVYGLFLKTADHTSAAAAARLQDVERALRFIAAARLASTEPLATVLERVPQHIPKSKVNKSKGLNSDEARAVGQKWPAQHAATSAKLKLSDKQSTPPIEFLEQALRLMVPRAAEAMWLKIAQRQRTHGFEWKTGHGVAPVTMSVRYANLAVNKFPCVAPHSKYIIVKSGVLTTANAFVYLAVQGIQDRELSFLRLSSEPDDLLRDLAGNAFTANVVAIFLLAGLLAI